MTRKLEIIKYITVIFRNDGPLVCCGGSPSRRRVTIKLTGEQIEQLRPRVAYTSGGTTHYEEVDLMFADQEV